LSTAINFLLENNGGVVVQLLADVASAMAFRFGDKDTARMGELFYDNSTDRLSFSAGGVIGQISLDGPSGYVTFNPKGSASVATNAVRLEEIKTLGASPADDYSAALRLAPGYTGNFTVTRHNYLDLLNPTVAGSAVVTDAAVMRFDANAGTHKALATGSGGTSGYAKANLNGTLGYVPIYPAAKVQTFCARVERTSNQSINNNSATFIQFTTESYDYGSMVDLGADNTKITAPIAGVYTVTAYIEFAGNATGYRQMYVNSGGGSVQEVNSSITVHYTLLANVGALNLSGAVQLAANDYIKMTFYQNSGGALNVTKARMTMELVREN
jgi:hypothetical protein